MEEFNEMNNSMSAEAIVIGWEEGQNAGTVGKFIARDIDGNEFEMSVVDKIRTLQLMYDIAEWYIGKKVIFTYSERTPSGYKTPLFKTILEKNKE